MDRLAKWQLVKAQKDKPAIRLSTNLLDHAVIELPCPVVITTTFESSVELILFFPAFQHLMPAEIEHF